MYGVGLSWRRVAGAAVSLWAVLGGGIAYAVDDALVTCDSGAVLSRPPDFSQFSANSYASVRAAGQQVYERFDGVDGTVTGIRWWGVTATSPAFSDCTIGSPSFTVSFHEDNLSVPGGTLESFTVTPTITGTGETVSGLPVKLFEATFPSSFTLTSPGWVSVYDPNISASCRFYWLGSEFGGGQATYFNFSNLNWNPLNDDVAFCLIGTPGSEGEGGVDGEPDSDLECAPDTLFGQLPDLGAFGTGHFSVRSANRQVYERFTGVNEPIVAVRWWGIASLSPAGTACDLSATPLEISFSEEGGSLPGGEISSANVTPSITDTGQTVVGLPLLLFEAALPAPVTVTGGAGWISIYDTNINATCRFGWASSLDGNGQAKRFRFDGLTWEDVNDDLAVCLLSTFTAEGEGAVDGEGTAEGEGGVDGEGTSEGIVEGSAEGEGEPTDPTECGDGAILSRPPDFSIFSANSYASVRAANQQVYERYEGVNGTVTGIRWWGVTATSPAFSDCTIGSPSFTVSFHEDNLSTPGGTLQSFTVNPTITNTGETVSGLPVKLFEATFPNSFTLPSPGWVSVYDPNVSASCRFYWVGSEFGGGQATYFNFSNLSWNALNDDVSFCILGTESTEGEPDGEPDPNLTCSENTWFGQQPDLGPFATGHFSVRSTNRQVYERFTGVTSPIIGVRWWGIASVSPSGNACDLTSTPLQITFTQDGGSLPGGVIVSHTVTPTITNTGQTVASLPLLMFEADLPESVTVGDSAWVSIYDTNINATCRFGWASSLDGNGQAKRFRFDLLSWEDVNDDLAVCLLGDPSAEGEGAADGEGTSDGEGSVEGSVEGGSEGEGDVDGEGSVEGNIDGEGTIDGEGSVDGEGSADGEGANEGEGEISDLGIDCPEDSGFSQLVDLSESANYFSSNETFKIEMYEKITGTTNRIAAIRWWGTLRNQFAVPCFDDTASYRILFRESDGTFPSAEIASFNLVPTVTPTPVQMAGFDLYRFEATIPAPVFLPGGAGFVSIFMSAPLNNCGFFWSNSDLESDTAVGFNRNENEFNFVEFQDNLALCVITDSIAVNLLRVFQSADGSMDGKLDPIEADAVPGITPVIFDALDLDDDGFLSLQELQAQSGGDSPIHSADTNGDGTVDLAEVLRVIQFYNGEGYDCAGDPNSTEDGYELGDGKALSGGCVPHASDYQGEPDGIISLSELLRLIQLFNLDAFGNCPGGSEDGFCAAN